MVRGSIFHGETPMKSQSLHTSASAKQRIAVHKLRFTEAPETCFFPFLGKGDMVMPTNLRELLVYNLEELVQGCSKLPTSGGKLAIFVPIILQIGWSNPVVYCDCN